MLLCLITFQSMMMGSASARSILSFPRPNRIDVSGLSPFITALLAATVILGATLYPTYRMSVRPFLELHGMVRENGAFEVKEHFGAFVLLSAPAYWALWRAPLEPHFALSRRVLTYLLTMAVWWNFITGHIVNASAGF